MVPPRPSFALSLALAVAVHVGAFAFLTPGPSDLPAYRPSPPVVLRGELSPRDSAPPHPDPDPASLGQSQPQRGRARTTAAQVAVAPMAAVREHGSGDEALIGYQSLLAAWLERYKRYPAAALRRRIEGRGLLQVSIDGRGNLRSSRLLEGLSSPILDQAVLDLARRASPFPPPPAGDGHYEFTVPVEFRLGRSLPSPPLSSR